MLMKGPSHPEKSWWEQNGGIVIVAMAFLGIALFALVMRLIIPR